MRKWVIDDPSWQPKVLDNSSSRKPLDPKTARNKNLPRFRIQELKINFLTWAWSSKSLLKDEGAVPGSTVFSTAETGTVATEKQEYFLSRGRTAWTGRRSSFIKCILRSSTGKEQTRGKVVPRPVYTLWLHAWPGWRQLRQHKPEMEKAWVQ